MADNLPVPDYFTKLAKHYARQTGDSTRRAFIESWDDINALKPITSSSVIHDNAAGPGTAMSVVVDRLTAAGSAVPEALVTDNVAAMVDAAREMFKAHGGVVAVENMDSQDLGAVPDGRFTHSLLSFSVFLLPDATKALREMRRTLQDGGVAALLTWKRFGASQVIHAAQRLVRPDGALMALPGKHFMDEGVLAQTARDAGFDAAAMQVLEKTVLVRGEQLEGLKSFFFSDFTKPARKEWTPEEEARWPEVLEQALKEETDKYGGVKFEVWVVLCKK